MSNSNRGPLATYNSLTDRHLAGFFANSRVREHLRRSGLITAEGEIINDATYRLNMARKDHKKHVKDLLAQAIVHKTLDIERLRQIEVKRRLEEIAKLETVRRIKADMEGPRQKSQTRDRKSEDMLLPLLSPSAQPRQFSARSLQQSRSSTRDALDRPASAPDQEPFQGGDKQKDNLDELPIDALRDYAITMNYEHTKRKDYNPYRVPQIPLPPKKDRVNRQTAKAQRIRQQQLQNKMKMEERPVYAGTEYRRPMPPMVHMPVLQSYCTVIMRYHGYGLNLVRQEIDYRQEIMVDQQHCGGNTRTVFKDMLAPGATFKFSSLRHQGYPFSLTLYIDGKVDSRVSTCCEFGHRPGSKLGHFSFVDIEGSSAKPCYKCQMGLTRPISHRRTPANPRPQSETVTVVNTRSGAASAQSQSRPQSRAQEQQQPTSEENVVVAVEKDEEEAAEEEEAAAKSPAPAAEEEAQAEAVGYADDFEEESKHSKEDEEEEEQTGKVEGLDDELSDREEPVVRARSASPAPSQDSSSSSSASRSVYSSSFEDDSGSEAGDKPGPDQQDAGKKDDEDRNDDGKDDAPGNDDDVQTPRVKGVGSDDDDDYDDDDDTRHVRGSPGRTYSY